MKFNNKKFKELRKNKKLTVSDVSNKIGVSEGTIYNYQAGRLMPSDEVLSKISKLFDLDVNDFLIEEHQNNKENALLNKYKEENERLWQMIAYFTQGKPMDLEKLLGNRGTSARVVSLFEKRYSNRLPQLGKKVA